MKIEQQLSEWVRGNSIHDDERNQCCPDFSCCNREINTPTEERELFAELHINNQEAEREKMLMMFLGRAISTIKPSKKVYIAGGKD